MSSKFFTNIDGNTLAQRLRAILEQLEIKNAEILSGYFFLSGFNQISKGIQSVEKTKILAGIKVDKLVFEAEMEGRQLNLFDSKKFTNAFIEEKSKDISEADYSESIENGIDVLSDLVSNGKLEIRIHREKQTHAKIYILREKEIANPHGTDFRGAVITGSSNLTASGLEKNFEFNVELRDSDDIEFALNTFDNLWEESIPITEEDILEIKNRTYLKPITPYELYLKFLIEHFGDRIDYNPKILEDLPKDFFKLAYQVDAVEDGFKKLKEHNGFFLSDVVGLGKTVVSAMITRKFVQNFLGEILIVCPPAIEQEWKETFEKFQIGKFRNFEIETTGSLHKVTKPEKYELVIVDESHKFKSHSTFMYTELERICKSRINGQQKKVILVSATPLNNRPQDIANQLYLFQDKRSSTIPSYSNLESFFAPIFKLYKEVISDKQMSIEDKLRRLKGMNHKIRENILKPVMVRRTRRDILEIPKYNDDLVRQKVKIPTKLNLTELDYKLDDDLVILFDKTVEVIEDKKVGLGYYRFRGIEYLDNKIQKELNIPKGADKRISDQLASIMRTILIKRLESSFFAFKKTLKRQERNLEIFIEMFNNDRIFIAPHLKPVNWILEDREDELIEKIESLRAEGDLSVKICKRDDFDEGFYTLLENDLKILKELNSKWELINQDPKFEDFIKHLKKQSGKIVIFSESSETTNLLKEKLENSGYNKILAITGENRDSEKEAIRENFDANFDGEQKDNYQIIITTEVLAEGVNLHRSNKIYNYDIPWNSTKLMQRIGRINRIGTSFDEIFVFNFKPTAESEDLIRLSERAYLKLQSFHDILGEDNKVYTEEEKVVSQKIFNFNEEEGERDEELLFLEEIRNFKEAEPEWFDEIQSLPNKIRVMRNTQNLKGFENLSGLREPNQTLVFLKNENFKQYLQVQENKLESKNFIDFAYLLKASEIEKAEKRIPTFHFEQVAKAFQSYDLEIQGIILEQNKTIAPKNPKDKQAIALLKELKKYFPTYEKNINKLIKSISEGQFQNLSKEILTLKKLKNQKDIVLELEKIGKRFRILNQNSNFKNETVKNIEIILSESFV